MPADGAPFAPSLRGHVELLDQPELYGQPDTRECDAWAHLLGRYPAHVFATSTFRVQKFYTDKHTGKVRAINRTANNGSVHPEAADKAWRLFVSRINREIWGFDWGKRWHRGIQWIRGTEFHKDGRLHFHALLSSPTNDLWNLTPLKPHHVWWRQEFGFNRLERPRSQQQVRDYVSEYVVKDGLLDFSRNYGSWLPCMPDFTTATVQDRFAGERIETPELAD
jgi:hypothetical protein